MLYELLDVTNKFEKTERRKMYSFFFAYNDVECDAEETEFYASIDAQRFPSTACLHTCFYFNKVKEGRRKILACQIVSKTWVNVDKEQNGVRKPIVTTFCFVRCRKKLH